MSRTNGKLLLALTMCVTLTMPTLAADEALRAFALTHSNSDSIVQVLKQVFDGKNVVLVSNARSNSIVVQANAAQMQQVQRIVAQLDRIGFERAGNVRQQGHIRRLGRPRPVPLARNPNIEVRFLDNGSVEIRAPTDTEYRVCGISTSKGAKVQRHDPLLLLDASNKELRSQLNQEVDSLRQRLAEVEAVLGRQRGARGKYDERQIAKMTRRAQAIRAGISEKTRSLLKLDRLEGVYAVMAEIDGVVTFVQTIEDYCPQGLPLEPRQLLIRIEPE